MRTSTSCAINCGECGRMRYADGRTAGPRRRTPFAASQTWFVRTSLNSRPNDAVRSQSAGLRANRDPPGSLSMCTAVGLDSEVQQIFSGPRRFPRTERPGKKWPPLRKKNDLDFTDESPQPSAAVHGHTFGGPQPRGDADGAHRHRHEGSVKAGLFDCLALQDVMS